jgi:hypothetical protein
VAKARSPQVRLTNNEIRNIMLRYFYDRNKNATSARGKKGSAVKISDVKKQLKAAQGLSQQEVQSNLTYLISQGWVEEESVEKSFTAPGGTVIPSSTNYFKITAAGIDKIEGPGEFNVGAIARLMSTDVVKAGDPRRAAEILVRVVKREHVPTHLILGARAVDSAHDYSRCQIAEAEGWRQVSTSADFGRPYPVEFPSDDQ